MLTGGLGLFSSPIPLNAATSSSSHLSLFVSPSFLISLPLCLPPSPPFSPSLPALARLVPGKRKAMRGTGREDKPQGNDVVVALNSCDPALRHTPDN